MLTIFTQILVLFAQSWIVIHGFFLFKFFCKETECVHVVCPEGAIVVDKDENGCGGVCKGNFFHFVLVCSRANKNIGRGVSENSKKNLKVDGKNGEKKGRKNINFRLKMRKMPFFGKK